MTMTADRRTVAAFMLVIAAASGLCAPAAAVVDSVREKIQLQQHWFDDGPVRQPPRGGRKSGDLTGLRTWHSQQPMLYHMHREVLPMLHQRQSSSRPLRILELGAGCGLLGIGLAALGEHVCLTDPAIPVNFEDVDENGERSSLDWLRDNVELNHELCGGRACARALAWGDADHEAALLEELRRPPAAAAASAGEAGNGPADGDGGWLAGGGPFDVVLGSDLLYNPDGYEALLHTLRTFCAAPAAGSGSGDEAPGDQQSVDQQPPSTLGLLVYPPRLPGEARFFAAAEEHFEVATRDIEVGDGRPKIVVAELTPRT